MVTAGTCPEFGGLEHGRRSLLVMRGGNVVLTPGDGVFELRGKADAAGHVTASKEPAHAGHQSYDLVFDGQLAEGVVVGAFASPRCRASVTMRAS